MLFAETEFSQSHCDINFLKNRVYAGLRHAIVIATKPHLRVTSSLNNKAKLGGDNNSVT